MKRNSEFDETIVGIANHARKQLNDFFETIKPTIAQTVSDMKELSESLQSYINESGILEAAERFREGIIETEADLKAFKGLMVKMNYPPHHGMDLYNMRKIAQKYKANENDTATSDIIEKFMLEYYNEEQMLNILNEWKTNPFLTKRIHILSDVIDAHNKEKYNLSIPIILSQLEGVVVDAFNIKNIEVDGEILSKLVKSLLIDEKKDNTIGFDQEIHTYYHNNIVEKFLHGEPVKSMISRNAIIHGANIEYGTVFNSLKLVMLFDHIADAMRWMDEDKRKRATRLAYKIAKRKEAKKEQLRRNQYRN